MSQALSLAASTMYLSLPLSDYSEELQQAAEGEGGLSSLTGIIEKFADALLKSDLDRVGQ